MVIFITDIIKFIIQFKSHSYYMYKEKYLKYRIKQLGGADTDFRYFKSCIGKPKVKNESSTIKIRTRSRHKSKRRSNNIRKMRRIITRNGRHERTIKRIT
jgi:hypothetical protein